MKADIFECKSIEESVFTEVRFQGISGHKLSLRLAKISLKI